MNFGKIAKRFAYANGLEEDMTADDGEELIGRNFAPGKLDKANAALEKLREQIRKRWKLDEDEE